MVNPAGSNPTSPGRVPSRLAGLASNGRASDRSPNMEILKKGSEEKMTRLIVVAVGNCKAYVLMEIMYSILSWNG